MVGFTTPSERRVEHHTASVGAEQIAQRRYGTTSVYIRDLIRRDQHRQHLRDLLLVGVASDPGTVAGRQYFDDLRDEVDTTPDG